MTKHYIGTKIVLAWPEVKDEKEGYAVKYADGYTSWSPKDVFEAAYVDIGHVGHLESWQQRVVGEKAELDAKLVKLDAALENDENKLYMADSQRALLNRQSDAMRAYSAILAERIAAF